jgi:hypothetical protein
MKNSAWGRLAFLLTVIILCNLTAACGMIAIHVMNNTYESLAGTRKDSAYKGSGFQKIIIVGITEDSSTRIAYENAFMSQFIGEGVNATISSTKLSGADSLKDKSLVENVIQVGGFDGVITVEVKNMADNETPQWLKTWAKIPVPGRDDLFSILAQADKSAPKPSENVRFEIVLWDGKTGRQVWVGTTIAVEKHWIARESHTAAHSTVKTLTGANLLRSTL